MEENGSRRPDQVAPSSDYRAKWIWPKRHWWSTRVDHRTRYGVGCGYAICNLAPRSEPEIILGFELSQFLRIDIDDQSINGPEGKVLNVDIKIPDEKLAVEFDGARWHHGQEDRDARKSKNLRNSGWQVISVRDRGLGPIAPSDVRVDTRRMSHKEVANRTLVKVYEVLGRDNTEPID